MRCTCWTLACIVLLGPTLGLSQQKYSVFELLSPYVHVPNQPNVDSPYPVVAGLNGTFCARGGCDQSRCVDLGADPTSISDVLDRIANRGFNTISLSVSASSYYYTNTYGYLAEQDNSYRTLYREWYRAILNHSAGFHLILRLDTNARSMVGVSESRGVNWASGDGFLRHKPKTENGSIANPFKVLRTPWIDDIDFYTASGPGEKGERNRILDVTDPSLRRSSKSFG